MTHAWVLDESKLAYAETALADSVPFGDEARISANVDNLYLGLLAAIASDVPGARLLLRVLNGGLPALRQTILRDALLRRTIEDGYCVQILHRDTITFEELDELLTEAARLGTRDGSQILIESANCRRMPTSAGGSWIWTDSTLKSLPARRFVKQCLCRLPAVSLDCPSDQHYRNLLEGAELAHASVPQLARSALSHVLMIGVATPIATPFKSMTVVGLPGIVFLTPAVLVTPLRAAEALLHESIHLKFIDIDYSEHLFARGFRAEASPKFTPPWHAGTANGEWPVDRILTSMHVNLALTVFFGRVGQRAHQEGSADGVHSSERAFQAMDRARCLLVQAQESREYLSANGSRFVAWIEQTLEDLDPRSG
jgi:hypothetical protein